MPKHIKDVENYQKPLYNEFAGDIQDPWWFCPLKQGQP